MADKDTNQPTVEPHSGHAWRVFGVVGLLVASALVVRALLVPDTFGQYGRYRGATVAEARKRAPRHVGVRRCAECHDKEARAHAKDAHGTVACETCHGPGRRHVESEGSVKPRVNRSKALCLRCHQQLAARPAGFPQVDVGGHFRMLGVTDPKTECVQCHNPHEPLFMDKDLRTARLHPLIHRCRDCHPGRTNERMPRPASHPPIFQCRYCHAKRVTDFRTRKHHKLRCTTCHVFHRETEFAGRIVRDTDPRFCLLCHRKTRFKGKGSPPLIDPKKHIEEPGTSCMECHEDAIHGELPKGPTTPLPATVRPRPRRARQGGGARPAVSSDGAAARPRSTPPSRAGGMNR